LPLGHEWQIQRQMFDSAIHDWGVDVIFGLPRDAKYNRQARRMSGTSGPGEIHLPNGLYDAKLDDQPVLAITGQQ
jgi:glyoxylate carboligase